jgi:hypothetical protein
MRARPALWWPRKKERGMSGETSYTCRGWKAAGAAVKVAALFAAALAAVDIGIDAIVTVCK